MGSKASFTESEWHDLQWALMLAGSHVTASDWPGLWGGFKTAAAGSRLLSMMQSSDNQLVADLAKDQARKRPPDIKDRAGLASDVAIERIRAATQLVATKAPEDLDDWKNLLESVAEVMAEEVDGVSPKETEAIARVKAALDTASARGGDTGSDAGSSAE